MMKIVASLVILGLCANLCFGAAVTSSSNSGAFSSSVLNSSATQILKGTNSTDSAVWDSSAAAVGTTQASNAGVYNSDTWFGPGATNDTSYLWGFPSSGYAATVTTGGGSMGAAGSGAGEAGYVYTQSAIRKRTINNTIVGWANDTSEASVVSDTSISTSIIGSGTGAVGPGYIAYLSTGLDTAATPNYQVYITLIGTSASTTKLTSTADVWASSASVPAVSTSCTTTTFGVGNVWYDIGAGAFFYTYWKNVETAVPTATNNAGTCGSFIATGSTVATSIYLGGIYLNGTAYWTTPITVSAGVAGDSINYLVGGGDNWLNSSNIYIAYQDAETSPYSVYYSKTTKSSATTAVGSFSQLIKGTTTTPTAGTTVTMIYYPVSVWSSNFTYGITLANKTTTAVTNPSSTTSTYMYTNFINGSTTGVDSGLSNSAASGFGSFAGWQLNTGYTIVASWQTGTNAPIPTSYTYATYYGNGTANTTATTLGSITYAAGPQFYEDVNGTQWIGWTDVDYANSDWTYNAYLAKFQGQLNVPSGANVLSALSAVVLFFAAIFMF